MFLQEQQSVVPIENKLFFKSFIKGKVKNFSFFETKKTHKLQEK